MDAVGNNELDVVGGRRSAVGGRVLISGFTFMRNTSSLYYPFVESIKSILPIVDEFVIAMGDNSPGDQTENKVREIGSDKIKIIHTKWDIEKYQQGTIYAQQTDLAMKACTGDWLFYLQSDEVLHEKYLDVVSRACAKYLNDERVEGFLFHYKHFWGDYDHYVKSHAWYPKEIRIVRNKAVIHSYGDAQSFKIIKEFDGINYRTKQNTSKLQVKLLDACIYHYGWVRPPVMMQTKNKKMDSFYHDQQKVESSYQKKSLHFDYGNLSKFPMFAETHPAVMNDFIKRFNWQDDLHYEINYKPRREPLKHEKWKYKLLSWIEENLFDGEHVFGYKNWKLMK
jgi:hypothetical protein